MFAPLAAMAKSPSAQARRGRAARRGVCGCAKREFSQRGASHSEKQNYISTTKPTKKRPNKDNGNTWVKAKCCCFAFRIYSKLFVFALFEYFFA